jgi:aromatic-L-amino-acid decarboxylase
MEERAEGLGATRLDMNSETFRHWGREVIDRVAAYLERPESWRVLPDVRPGELTAALPAAAPAEGEPFERILADYDRLVPSATTHWNHPGFMAYFAVSATGAGILAETLSAALNVNAMVWRTGPAATELEQVTAGWVLGMLGLPETWDGTINDTASTSTLYALAAAREARPELEIRERGLAGRSDLPRLRIYCSEEAHSSVDKAAVALGLGLEGVTRVSTDNEFRMDPAALERAIASDRKAGILPMAVVATVGTTSTTSVDPVPAIGAICQREGIWLHVDTAYGGPAAVLPEMRWILDGCELADSLVVNPHKWMFVPIDCSLLYTSKPEVLKRAFSIVPAYLTTTEGQGVKNLMDHGISLGRRFRALKLWFVLRAFGVSGLASVLREQLRLARLFADWVDREPGFERLAAVPFSVVNFRHRPPGLADGEVDAWNAALLERVNASGEVFLSHTRIRGRFALHLAIGNIRTEEKHVRRAWQLVKTFAAAD